MIVVVGVSHKTAPIELREQLALPDERAAELCRSLVSRPDVAEAFVVSTCNRVEVIAVPSELTRVAECSRECVRLLCQGHPELENHAYVREGKSGMRHLVRVAASLDSLVVGEPQILGQLKAGFQLARDQGTVGQTLHRAFSAAVRGAKRVRSETSIGVGQVSVPSIAVQLADQIFGELRGHRVVLVGSGEMGKSVASLFLDQGARLVVVGRSLERVEVVTRELGGEAATMDQLGRLLGEADVVVSSTSAEHAVITQSAVKQVWKARRGRNLFLIDLAVPRDIEPRVGELDGAFLYNIDDLSQVADESTEARKKEAERAAALVEGVVQRFERSWQAHQATPVIKALRARMREALEVEMRRSLRGRLKELDDDQRAAVAKMLDAGINRILHAPTTRIREEAGRAGVESVDEVLSMLSELFQLEDPDAGGILDSLAPPGPVSEKVEDLRQPVVAPQSAEDDSEEEGKEASGSACVPARFSGA